MNKNIQITSRNLPKEITEDIQNLSLISNLEISIVHIKSHFSNFSGGPVDIEIGFNIHLTELIIEGLIVPVVYDALKYSIKTIWKKLTKYYHKKNIKIEDDKNYILLSFNLKPDRAIEYRLDGTLNEQTIENLNEKIFDYLKDANKHNQDFLNPDFKDRKEMKPKIRMRFNQETNTWHPVNYSEIEKWYKEQNKLMQDKLTN